MTWKTILSGIVQDDRDYRRAVHWLLNNHITMALFQGSRETYEPILRKFLQRMRTGGRKKTRGKRKWLTHSAWFWG